MNTIPFQIITVIIQAYIANTHSRKRIMIATLLFNIFTASCFFLIEDFTTLLMYAIIIVRSFIYIYQEKLQSYNFIPFIFIALHLIVGAVTISGVYQIIAILIPCYTVYYLWFYKTNQKLRIGNILANSAWGIYNFISGLYIICVSRIITVIVNILAYIKNKRKETEYEKI